MFRKIERIILVICFIIFITFIFLGLCGIGGHPKSQVALSCFGILIVIVEFIISIE